MWWPYHYHYQKNFKLRMHSIINREITHKIFSAQSYPIFKSAHYKTALRKYSCWLIKNCVSIIKQWDWDFCCGIVDKCTAQVNLCIEIESKQSKCFGINIQVVQNFIEILFMILWKHKEFPVILITISYCYTTHYLQQKRSRLA